jgi:hypothetical protein
MYYILSELVYNVLSEITEQYVYRFMHQHYVMNPLWGAQAGLQSYRYVFSACKSRNEMLPDAGWRQQFEKPYQNFEKLETLRDLMHSMFM